MIQIRRFTLIPFIALLVASLMGCSQQEEDVPQPQEKEDGVTLRLVIDTGAESSRAVAPDYFEKPDGEFENIYTLRVIIVKVTGSESVPDKIEANRLVHTTSTGEPIDDHLQFKVSTGSKKIYLIANEASLSLPRAVGNSYVSVTDFLDNAYKINSEFSSTVFDGWMVNLPGNQAEVTQSLYSDNSNAKGLPLTEFFDFNVGATPETQQYDDIEYVKLFLTRAAAKVTYSVEVDPEYKGSGVNVTGIRLNGLNMQQYVFPRNAEYSIKNEDGSVTPIAKDAVITPTRPSVITPLDRFITSFDTPARLYPERGGASIVMNLAEEDYIAIKAGNEKTVGPAYFPESKIPNTTEKFSVQVELDGDGNWLEAKPLGVGEYNGVANNILQINGAQAIARNTHLKITIRFSDNDITATVQLVPYIGVVLNPTFGFDEVDPKNPNQNN